MRRFRILFVMFILLAAALSIQTACAQDDPSFETGLKQFGSYHGGNIDAVGLSNGSLNVDIPLISYPQRGGKLKLEFALRYENRSDYSDPYCISNFWGTQCATIYGGVGRRLSFCPASLEEVADSKKTT